MKRILVPVLAALILCTAPLAAQQRWHGGGHSGGWHHHSGPNPWAIAGATVLGLGVLGAAVAPRYYAVPPTVPYYGYPYQQPYDWQYFQGQ